MCDRRTNLSDPTADFVLSGAVRSERTLTILSLFVDLLGATEDLVDFSTNVLDTIRLQSHFNDRNRRVNLGTQLKDAAVETSDKRCAVVATLKYDLSLYLNRILQACKRTKVRRAAKTTQS